MVVGKSVLINCWQNNLGQNDWVIGLLGFVEFIEFVRLVGLVGLRGKWAK